MNRKVTWIAWLLIFCFAITPNIVADDDDEDFGDEDRGVEIICTGSGSTETGAYGNAWRDGMKKWLRENMHSGDFNANENGISGFVDEKWKDYIIPMNPENEDEEDYKNVDIRTRYSSKKGKIKFVGRMDNDRLLKDVQFKFTKAREKFEGMSAAFLPDDYKKFKSEKLDCDIMYDTINDGMNKHVVTKDLRAIDELIKTEAIALGMPSSADPATFVARKFNEVNIMIYLWMTTDVMYDQAAQTNVWKATIGCRADWRPTAQQLWHFQIDSLRDLGVGEFSGVIPNREARQRVIAATAKEVVKKIIKEVTNYQTILNDSEFQVKFVKFDSSGVKKLERVVADLETGKRAPMKILPGGGVAGDGYFVIKMKWRNDADSQQKMVRIIKETCLDNGLRVTQKMSSPGVIIFAPEGDSED